MSRNDHKGLRDKMAETMNEGFNDALMYIVALMNAIWIDGSPQNQWIASELAVISSIIDAAAILKNLRNLLQANKNIK
jgi:hypothetical protein